MEQEKIIFKADWIGAKCVESTPEQDLGLDWDVHSDCDVLKSINYRYFDSGLVPVDQLISKLNELKSSGANYVACDWNEDHQELEVYGVDFRLATETERVEYFNLEREKEEEAKQRRIAHLEQQLKQLKSE
jgi:hypothetical protein